VLGIAQCPDYAVSFAVAGAIPLLNFSYRIVQPQTNPQNSIETVVYLAHHCFGRRNSRLLAELFHKLDPPRCTGPLRSLMKTADWRSAANVPLQK